MRIIVLITYMHMAAKGNEINHLRLCFAIYNRAEHYKRTAVSVYFCFFLDTHSSLYTYNNSVLHSIHKLTLFLHMHKMKYVAASLLQIKI